jgi:hypothetical protein
MQWHKQIKILMLLAAGWLAAFAGCTLAPPVNKILKAEEALVAAGFQLKTADTQAKIERIRRIPQKRVVRAMVGNREVYLWADAEGCRCYYTGTRHDYTQLLENQREEKTDQRIYWYEAQHDDPLWFAPGWDD